ncbi:MAG: hypothetical protein ABIO99_05660, partial [Candidatus Limnocylindria bacterium]
MRRLFPLAALLLAGCAAVGGGVPPSVSSSPSPEASPSSRPLPELTPPAGTAWFGMNLDWANDSVADVTGRLGASPSVWVQFVRFPLDDGGRGNLDAFVEQVATVNGIALITLEPHDGLASVTPEAAEEFA